MLLLDSVTIGEIVNAWAKHSISNRSEQTASFQYAANDLMGIDEHKSAQHLALIWEQATNCDRIRGRINGLVEIDVMNRQHSTLAEKADSQQTLSQPKTSVSNFGDGQV